MKRLLLVTFCIFAIGACAIEDEYPSEKLKKDCLESGQVWVENNGMTACLDRYSASELVHGG